jgi:SAM-dependent methyltransferase
MAAAVRPYYAAGGASTEYYDLVTDADRSLVGDIDIYAALAEHRTTVLELGAGTGRVAIGLAERGFAVTGLDLSAPMLTQAEAKRAALEPDVRDRLGFVRGDMTALALGRRFDAIFATYFTLAHLPITSWKRALAGMARHLAPGGIVALHLPIVARMADPPPPPTAPVFARAIGDGRTLRLYVAGKDHDPAAGRMVLLLDYVTLGADGAEIDRRRERLTFHMADPEPYAAAAGLRTAGMPIAVGASGFIHLFEAKGNGADDGT